MFNTKGKIMIEKSSDASKYKTNVVYNIGGKLYVDDPNKKSDTSDIALLMIFVITLLINVILILT